MKLAPITIRLKTCSNDIHIEIYKYDTKLNTRQLFKYKAFVRDHSRYKPNLIKKGLDRYIWFQHCKEFRLFHCKYKVVLDTLSSLKPNNARFIAKSSSCMTKELSKLLTLCLTAV